MKILIIMDGFFPGKKYGGPPVSVSNFCSLMINEECFIVTRNHDKDEKEEYKGIKSNEWIERNNCHVKYLSNKMYGLKKFDEIIQEIKPDVLYLQGLFQPCVLPCLLLAKKRKVNVLLAPRGELCKGAFKKKYKKIPYIGFLRLSGLIKDIAYQSTSEEETNAIHKILGASYSTIHYLTNVPSISNIKYVRNTKEIGVGRFVFISRIHPKKNLITAIKLLNNIKGKACFDIYGPIEDDEYWKKCQDEISKLPPNIVVKYQGLLSHNEVHKVFSRYDAFLFPTYSENYGHVIAEALNVGTPVIISDNTPWCDINYTGAGWAIPLEQGHKYEEAINVIVSNNQFQQDEMEKACFEYIDNKNKIDELRIKYKSILSTFCVRG